MIICARVCRSPRTEPENARGETVGEETYPPCGRGHSLTSCELAGNIATSREINGGIGTCVLCVSEDELDVWSVNRTFVTAK